MENIGQQELITEELLTLLESLPWEDHYKFSFNGTNIMLIITPAETVAQGIAGVPAEYFKSTRTDGFDIYLHDTIPETMRKRMLFHEIMECNLRNQGFSLHEAHQITLDEEQKTFGLRAA